MVDEGVVSCRQPGSFVHVVCRVGERRYLRTPSCTKGYTLQKYVHVGILSSGLLTRLASINFCTNILLPHSREYATSQFTTRQLTVSLQIFIQTSALQATSTTPQATLSANEHDLPFTSSNDPIHHHRHSSTHHLCTLG